MRLVSRLRPLVVALALALPFWLGVPSIAHAEGGTYSSSWSSWWGFSSTSYKTTDYKYDDDGGDWSNYSGGYCSQKTQDVPELDPSAAGAAGVLLAGGALILFDRRRRQLS